MLDGLPRYARKGIFENIYVGADGSVVVSYVGVSSEDFVAYTDELIGAGCRLQESCPNTEEYLRLTEELYRALTPEIFKKSGEIMNISSRNHCGPGESVL